MQILVVDDEPSMRDYLSILLSKESYQVFSVGNLKDALLTLKSKPFGLVLSDMKLGAESGMSVLKAARAMDDPPEVIMITAFGTPLSAVEAMREGAYDYISKPFDNEELKLLIQKALEKRGLRKANDQLRESLVPEAGKFWVGRSQPMHQVWLMVEKVAPSPSTVLIAGESGTGKELVAKALHLKSNRSGNPFVPLNCGALAEGVLESELFGHVKGAFTGATTDRSGILVSAGDGTVFLDEIGEISLGMQVKLLRVLQERRVKPVGSSTEVPFQARIVAATNRSLDKEVKAGKFREDLYYRLNVITIELPPLRQRAEDIPLLAHHFLSKVAATLGRPSLRFTPEALTALTSYSFPGNVRQLQNVVERAATLAESNEMGPDSLPPTLRGDQPSSMTPGLNAPVTLGSLSNATSLPFGFSLERHLDEAERKHLVASLQQAQGVKTKAAELLGLSFRSFRYRLAKHGLGDEVGTS